MNRLTPPYRSNLIEHALDAHVLANETSREHDGMWHPSSISGCARKAVYEMRQVQPTNPLTAKQKRVFFIGHLLHEKMQAAMAASPHVSEIYTEVQVRIPELGVGGAADQVVVLVSDDGTAELLEFKSIKEWGWKKLTGPKEDHLEQIKPYFIALREYGGVDQDGKVLPPLGDKLRRVRFAYIEKATLDIKEYTVEWDPEWVHDVQSKVAILDEYRDDSLSLPPRLPASGGKKDYRCDWGWGKCAFFDRCWNTDGEGISPESVW